jgi:hypothetical protein
MLGRACMQGKVCRAYLCSWLSDWRLSNKPRAVRSEQLATAALELSTLRYTAEQSRATSWRAFPTHRVTTSSRVACASVVGAIPYAGAGGRHKTELGRRPRRARGGHRHRGAIANAGLCCGEELRGLEERRTYGARCEHPGVLDAKEGYFGVKSAKVYRIQMGTKPAKVGRLGPRCAKVRRGLHPAPTGASAKRSSIHAASKVAKVGAAGGPKLLKWACRLRARQGQIC